MSIHFKFSSQKDFETIKIDGASISLGKLKQNIIALKKLGKSQDFDLLVKNAQTKTEYKGDATLVPKNTSVLVERVPVTSGVRIPGLSQSHTTAPFIPGISKPIVVEKSTIGEDEKIKTLFSQPIQDGTIENMHDKYHGQSRVPPPSYICHRCNKPGHYIQFCPTNDDPNIQVVKVRKATGIPKSFLKQTDDFIEGGVLLPTGGYATVMVNDQEFDKLVSRDKPRIIPSGLSCPICKRLFESAVLIPCCGVSYCDGCVTRSLVEDTKMHCPNCKKKLATLDNLIPNMSLRASVEDFRKGFDSKDDLNQPTINQSISEKIVAQEKPELKIAEVKQVEKIEKEIPVVVQQPVKKRSPSPVKRDSRRERSPSNDRDSKRRRSKSPNRRDYDDRRRYDDRGRDSRREDSFDRHYERSNSPHRSPRYDDRRSERSPRRDDRRRSPDRKSSPPKKDYDRRDPRDARDIPRRSPERRRNVSPQPRRSEPSRDLDVKKPEEKVRDVPKVQERAPEKIPEKREIVVEKKPIVVEKKPLVVEKRNGNDRNDRGFDIRRGPEGKYDIRLEKGDRSRSPERRNRSPERSSRKYSPERKIWRDEKRK